MAVPPLVSAEEAAFQLSWMNSIEITAARLIELAEAGYLPHHRVAGGPPLFVAAEIKAWIWENMTERWEGRPLPIPVERPETGGGPVVPPPLADLSHLLTEIPPQLARPFSCIYFLVEADRVVYVGQTTNLLRRIGTHESGPFDRVLYLPVADEDRSQAERVLLRSLRPERNGPATYANVHPSAVNDLGSIFVASSDGES